MNTKKKLTTGGLLLLGLMCTAAFHADVALAVETESCCATAVKKLLCPFLLSGLSAAGTFVLGQLHACYDREKNFEPGAWHELPGQDLPGQGPSWLDELPFLGAYTGIIGCCLWKQPEGLRYLTLAVSMVAYWWGRAGNPFRENGDKKPDIGKLVVVLIGPCFRP
ncbi:MAG: hypothetical protein M1549_04055 [Candidatus Dependentiae bacterium]|nr:hypothetical protein [Candidatus Dependentiae bacterium]